MEEVAAKTPLPPDSDDDGDDSGSGDEGSEGAEASLSDGVGLHETGDDGASTPPPESSRPSGELPLERKGRGEERSRQGRGGGRGGGESGEWEGEGRDGMGTGGRGAGDNIYPSHLARYRPPPESSQPSRELSTYLESHHLA